MTFLLKRGSRRVAHLAQYDVFGRISGSWCGRSNDYDLTSNVPWGRPRCKTCVKKENAALSAAGWR